MRDYIGCGIPVMVGHLMVAYFIGTVVAMTKGNEIGLIAGICYALLFPFIIMMAWNIGGKV